MIPSTVRKHFFSVLSETEKDIHSFVNNPGSDMTRHRYCDFQDTVLATMSLSMNRTNTELLNFFGIENPHIPSKSAFTQQRRKFNSLLFPHLLNAFNQAVPFKKVYKGYHLVAVDGSDLNLPTNSKDTVYRIKQARSEGFFYQMHINALFDICENRYVSAVMQPRPKMNEHKAFCQLVAECSLPENTIFIADRGYPTLNTIAHLLDQNKYFLIRAKSPSSSGSLTYHLLEPGRESDRTYRIYITRSRKHAHPSDFDKYVSLRKNRKFDFIKPEDRDTFYTISIRVTCIRLNDDSYEYLISNLPEDEFSPSDLKELYWKRWSIETSFRRLKYALSLAYLHSVNRDLIIQEIYAKMIMYNFASLIHDYAQKCIELLEKQKEKKYRYNVAFDDTVPIARELLRQYIKNSKEKALLLKHLTAIKESTSSARHVRSQTVNPLNNRA